jgi:hypothetical protein
MTPTRARTVVRAIKTALALEAETDPIRVGELETLLDRHLPLHGRNDPRPSSRRAQAAAANRNKALRRALEHAKEAGFRIERESPVSSTGRKDRDATRFPYVVARQGTARAWRRVRVDATTFDAAAELILSVTRDVGEAARALARIVTSAAGVQLREGVAAIRRHLPPGARVSHPPGATGQMEALIFLANAAGRAVSDGSLVVPLEDALLLTAARNARALRLDVEPVVRAGSSDGGELPEFELDVDTNGVASARPLRFLRSGFTPEEAVAMVPGLVRLLVAGGRGAAFARSIARLCPAGTVPPSLGGVEEEDEW